MEPDEDEMRDPNYCYTHQQIEPGVSLESWPADEPVTER